MMQRFAVALIATACVVAARRTETSAGAEQLAGSAVGTGTVQPVDQILDLLLSVKADVQEEQSRDAEGMRATRLSCHETEKALQAQVQTEVENFHAVSARRERLEIAVDVFQRESTKLQAQIATLGGQEQAAALKPSLATAIADAERRQKGAQAALSAAENAQELVKGLLLEGQGGELSFLEVGSRRVATHLGRLATKLQASALAKESDELEELLKEAETQDRTLLSDRLAQHLGSLRLGLQSTLGQVKENLVTLRGQLQRQVDTETSALANPEAYDVKTDRARRVTALQFALEELTDKLESTQEELKMVDVEGAALRAQLSGSRKALAGQQKQCSEAEAAFSKRMNGRKAQLESVSNAGTVMSGQLLTLHELLDPTGDRVLRDHAAQEVHEQYGEDAAHADEARAAYIAAVGVADRASSALTTAVEAAAETHGRVLVAQKALVEKMQAAALARKDAEFERETAATHKDISKARDESSELHKIARAAEEAAREAQRELDLLHAELASRRARAQEAELSSNAAQTAARAHAAAASAAGYKSHVEMATRELEHAKHVLSQLRAAAEKAPEASDDDAFLLGVESKAQMEKDVVDQEAVVSRLRAVAATATAHMSDLLAAKEHAEGTAATAGAAFRENADTLMESEMEKMRLRAAGAGPLPGTYGEGSSAMSTGMTGLSLLEPDLAVEAERMHARAEELAAEAAAKSARVRKLVEAAEEVPVEAAEAEINARDAAAAARKEYQTAMARYSASLQKEEHVFKEVTSADDHVLTADRMLREARAKASADKRDQELSSLMTRQMKQNEELLETLVSTSATSSEDQVALARAKLAAQAARENAGLTELHHETSVADRDLASAKERHEKAVARAHHLHALAEDLLVDVRREHVLASEEERYAAALEAETASATQAVEDAAKSLKLSHEDEAASKKTVEAADAELKSLVEKKVALEKELKETRDASADAWATGREMPSDTAITERLRANANAIQSAQVGLKRAEEAHAVSSLTTEAHVRLHERAVAVAQSLKEQVSAARAAARLVKTESERAAKQAKEYSALSTRSESTSQDAKTSKIALAAKAAEAKDAYEAAKRKAASLFATARKEIDAAAKRDADADAADAVSEGAVKTAAEAVAGHADALGSVSHVAMDASTGTASPFDTVHSIESDMEDIFESELGSAEVEVGPSAEMPEGATGAASNDVTRVTEAKVVKSMEGELMRAAESAILRLANQLGLHNVHGPSGDAVEAAEEKQEENAAEASAAAASTKLQALSNDQVAFARKAANDVASSVQRKAEWIVKTLRAGGRARFALREAQLRAATSQAVTRILRDETMRAQMQTLWNHALVLGTPALATGAGDAEIPGAPTGAHEEFLRVFEDEVPRGFPGPEVGITGAEGVDRLEQADSTQARIFAMNAKSKATAATDTVTMAREAVKTHRNEHDVLAVEANSALVQPDRRTVAREEVLKSSAHAKEAMEVESETVVEQQRAQAEERAAVVKDEFVAATIDRAESHFAKVKKEMKTKFAKVHAEDEKEIGSLESRNADLAAQLAALRNAMLAKQAGPVAADATGATGPAETGATGVEVEEPKTMEEIKEEIRAEVVQELAPTGIEDVMEAVEQEKAAAEAEVGATALPTGPELGATGVMDDDYRAQRAAEAIAQEQFEEQWLADEAMGQPLSGSLPAATGPAACTKFETVPGFGEICVEHHVKLAIAHKIVAAKKDMHHAKTRVEDLRKTVDSLSAAKAALEEQVAALKAREASHDQVLGTVKAQLHDLRTERVAQLKAAEAQMAALRPRLHALNNRIHTISGDIATAHTMMHKLGHAHKPMLKQAQEHLRALRMEEDQVREAREQLQHVLDAAKQDVDASVSALTATGPAATGMQAVSAKTVVDEDLAGPVAESGVAVADEPAPAAATAADMPVEEEETPTVSKLLEQSADDLKVKANSKALAAAELKRDLEQPGLTPEQMASIEARIKELKTEAREDLSEAAEADKEASQAADLSKIASDTEAETVEEIAEDLEVQAAEAELNLAKLDKEADALTGEAGLEASRRAAAARAKAKELRATASQAEAAARADADLKAREKREAEKEDASEADAYREGAAVQAIAKALGIENGQRDLTAEQIEAAQEVSATFKQEQARSLLRASAKGEEMAAAALHAAQLEAMENAAMTGATGATGAGAAGVAVIAPTGLAGADGIERDALEEIANRQFSDAAARDAIAFDRSVGEHHANANVAADSAEDYVDYLRARTATGASAPAATGPEASARKAAQLVREAHVKHAAAEGGATIAETQARVTDDAAEDRNGAVEDAEAYSEMLKNAAKEAERARHNAEVASQFVGRDVAQVDAVSEAADRSESYARRADSSAAIARVAAARAQQASRASLHEASTRASEADAAMSVVNFESLGHAAAHAKLAESQSQKADAHATESDAAVQAAASKASETPSVVPAAEQLSPRNKAFESTDLPSMSFRATRASLSARNDNDEAEAISAGEADGTEAAHHVDGNSVAAQKTAVRMADVTYTKAPRTTSGTHGTVEEVLANSDYKTRQAYMAKTVIDQHAHKASTKEDALQTGAETAADSRVNDGSAQARQEVGTAAHEAAVVRRESNVYDDLQENAKNAYSAMHNVVESKNAATAAKKAAESAKAKLADAKRAALAVAEGLQNLPGDLKLDPALKAEDKACEGDDCDDEQTDGRHRELESTIEMSRRHSDRAANAANEASKIVREQAAATQFTSFLQLEATEMPQTADDLLPKDPAMRAMAREEESNALKLENQRIQEAMGGVTGGAGCTGVAAQSDAADADVEAQQHAAAMEEAENLNVPLRLPKDWHAFDGELAPALAHKLHQKAHHQAEVAEELAGDRADVAAEAEETARRASWRADRVREQLKKEEEEHKEAVKEAALRARQRLMDERARAMAWKQQRDAAMAGTGATGLAAAAGSASSDDFADELATLPPPYTEEEVKLVTAGPTGIVMVPDMPTSGLTGGSVSPMPATGASAVLDAADDAEEDAEEAQAASEAAMADADARRQLEVQLRSTKSDAAAWARVVRRAKAEKRQQDTVSAQAAVLAAGEKRASAERIRVVQPKASAFLEVARSLDNGEEEEKALLEGARSGESTLAQDAADHVDASGTKDHMEHAVFEALPVEGADAGTDALEGVVQQQEEILSAATHNEASIAANAIGAAVAYHGDEAANNAVAEVEAKAHDIELAARQHVSAMEAKEALRGETRR